MKFNGLHLSKNYIPSPKTLFPDLSNITFNWLLVWKMTWGIWHFIPEQSKLEFWWDPLIQTWKSMRGVICHDNEELCKIWRGTDLSFQSWPEEFNGFWFEHLQVPKIFILMGSFCAKYKLFELKKYSGVIFHETEEG